MLKALIAATGAALLTFGAQGPAAAEGPSVVPETIEWAITPSGNDHDDQIQLTLSYRSRGSDSQWSNSSDLRDLQGLDPAQLASREGVPVQFRIVRDAGSFDCDGIVRRERGTGECRFAGDPAFAAALETHGIAPPTPAEQFGLAMARVGLELVETLERHHYPRPTVDALMRGGIHGVTPAYVQSMTQAGYHVGDLDGLVDMRIHGVTADYVGALARAGYRPDAEMLRQLAIHGVTARFIGEMDQLGYRQLSAEDIVSLRIHGVTADYVRELAELGYRGLTPDQLRNLRIHGVTAGFVRARLRSNDRPSPEELVSLRIHGG